MGIFSFRDTVRSARFSLTVCGFLFSGCIIAIFPQPFWEFLALESDRAFTWSGFYTLLTYWLIHPGLLFWLWVSASFVLSGMILEREYSYRTLAVLIACGFVVGGLAFALLEETQAPLVGSVMGAWSYGGAALITVFLRWRNTHLLAKLYAFFLCYSFVVTIDATSVAIGQTVAGLFGIAYASFANRFMEIRAKRLDSSSQQERALTSGSS